MTEQQMTPEQVEELREKLKNMSPEELREFQKKQCIFCHIIAGKVQSKKIYEDSQVIAILDINPSNPGHILLLPKEHYAIMPQLPEEDLKHIFMVAKSLSNVLLRSIDATGTNILVANGPAAGQKAQHFMVHVIPRQDDDTVGFSVPKRKTAEAELDRIVPMLQKKMAELTGKKLEKKDQIALPKEKRQVMEEKMLAPKKEGKKVVEAQIVEQKEEIKEQIEEKKDEKKPAKKTKKSDEIDLDDIAKVLGLK